MITVILLSAHGIGDARIDGFLTGSGAATRQMLDKLNETPVLREGLNKSEMIPRNALARLERDEAFRGLDVLREDLQNARRIIGEGPGWLDRLEAALKQGAFLPAVALGLLTAATHEDRAR